MITYKINKINDNLKVYTEIILNYYRNFIVGY